jgi:hypothetical protein
MKPMTPRQSRVRRRGAAWLGIVALVIQLFVPFFHAHTPARAATPDFPWDISDFCLTSGHLPPGYAPPSDQERPSKRQDHKVPPCSICKTLLHIGKCIPPAAAPVVCWSESTVQIRYGSPAVVNARWTISSSQPRAPPVLV